MGLYSIETDTLSITASARKFWLLCSVEYTKKGTLHIYYGQTSGIIQNGIEIITVRCIESNCDSVQRNSKFSWTGTPPQPTR